MTRHELHQKDMVITPLIFQGQSPYQIMTNHPELDISVRTLYSYLDKRILSARNIDLKRQVKFNPRKVHKTQIKDRSVFIRRMFSDFQVLELDHFAEMDTVHSSQDSKRVILTFFLTREKLFAVHGAAPSNTAPARYSVASSTGINALNNTKKNKHAIPYIVNGLISQLTIQVTNNPFGFLLIYLTLLKSTLIIIG